MGISPSPNHGEDRRALKKNRPALGSMVKTILCGETTTKKERLRLQNPGSKTLVIWDCQTADEHKLADRIQAFLAPHTKPVRNASRVTKP
jgi:hypothetical protein